MLESVPLLRKILLTVLQDELLPWSRNGSIESVILQPPAMASGESRFPMRRYAAALLEESGSGGTYFRHTHWPERGLLTQRFLYAGCVLEGPVELRIGTTARMAAEHSVLATEPADYVFVLPPRTLFLVPPLTPFMDGSEPHWQHQAGPPPDSRILWILTSPSGVLLHTCATRETLHDAHADLFVSDPRITELAEMMLEEQQTRGRNFEAMSRALLTVLFLRIEQSLNNRRYFLPDWRGNVLASGEEMQARARTGGMTVRRACEYIVAHHNEPLTVEEIARRFHVSPVHLNRLFRSEVGLPVMKYVTQSRLKTAQILLESTDLSIAEIGRCVGYNHLAHFSRVFTQWFEESPLEYRKHRRQKPA